MNKRTLSLMIAAAVGVLLLSIVSQTLRADVLTATYKENKWCIACHKGKNAALVAGWQKSGHAKAFWKVGQEKEGEKIVAQITPGGPIDRSKIAGVLGAGIRRQAYLDSNLKVLPAEWMTDTKSFHAIPAAVAATDCIACHVTAYNPAAKTWLEPGVSCQMCHGPGSEHMSASAENKKTTIVRPQTLTPQQRADICGQCHSVGKDTSGKYAFPAGFRPGMALATKFVDAKPTKHAAQQQYSELIQSPGHWKNGVVCDSCHDPHDTTGLPNQLKKPVNDLCLGCHKGKIAGTQHEDENLQKTTCAVCHMPDGSHFFRKPGS
jgi:predicted CXXCH cytochrome family protein